MNELKNNSITVKANIMTATEKTVNKAQVMELKVRIPADELAGKRDLLAGALKGTAQLVLTPGQTELDLDKPSKEADGQTEMIDKDGKVKNPVTKPAAKKPEKPKVSGETKAAKAEKANEKAEKSMAKSEKPKISGETKAAKAATKKESPVMSGAKKGTGVVDIASAAQKKAEAAK